MDREILNVCRTTSDPEEDLKKFTRRQILDATDLHGTGEDAIMSSARNSDPTCCKYLVELLEWRECGVRRDYKGQTALHISIKEENPVHMSLLIHFSKQRLLKIKCLKSYLPLHLVIDSRNMSLLRVLFLSADIGEMSVHVAHPVSGLLPLQSAMQWKDGFDYLFHNAEIHVIEALCVRGCPDQFETYFPSSTTMKTQDCIRMALDWNNTELAIHLLGKHDNGFACEMQAVRCAIRNQNTEVVSFLLGRGVQVDRTNDFPTTTACTMGNTDMLKCLLQNGFAVSPAKALGQINSFVTTRKLECLTLLLRHGIQVSQITLRLNAFSRRSRFATILKGAGCAQFVHRKQPTSALPLKLLCRMKVRDLCSGSNVYYAVDQLPLPSSIKDFLTVFSLDDNTTCRDTMQDDFDDDNKWM